MEGSAVALVKLKHQDDHIPYWCIDVPQDVQDFIKSNSALNPAQLWDEILKDNPTPAFSQKAVYHIWHNLTSHKWKHHMDEVQSVHMLIEEASHQANDLDPLYIVQSIHVHEEDGCIGITLAPPGLLKLWKDRICEISLDSTFNTNASNFEVFVLLGEVYGSGCPLGYLILHSNDGDPGAKERFISDFLKHFKQKWQLEPIVALTDKNFSEINAVQAVFPDAKYQLCFWHCLRAIKTCLSVLRRIERPSYSSELRT
ncbi:hypothetical protein C0995_005157 [Termitomyces sp. Mi166|nr:hypothetical protein C0995_005157 [Termitomyces sp. Mi166\